MGAREPCGGVGVGDVYVARQPILTVDGEPFGYELLFRDGPTLRARGLVDGTAASARLISTVALTFGIDAIAGGRPVFVNCTRETLDDQALRLLPAAGTVVELLEDVPADDDVVAACARLRAEGYRLALDDYRHDASMAPLLDLVDFLKVDFRATTAGERRALADVARAHGLRVVAEKVEDARELGEARALGCSLVQGHVYQRPELRAGRVVATSATVHVRLLSELAHDELDFDALADLVRQDVDLAYKFLRYAGSAGLGLRGRVTSLRHAFVLLGEASVRRWVAAAAVGKLIADEPSELAVACAVRGQLCEAIGEELDWQDRRLELFSLGLFSLADGLFDQPLDEALAHLPISEEVAATLRGAPTDLAGPLELVRAYEAGDWERVEAAARRLGCAEAPLARRYVEALRWSDSIMAA